MLAPPAIPALGVFTSPATIATGLVTAVVLVGALAALSVPTYKGVLSATGLFYVATMSVAGFVILAATLRPLA